ncbi:MAG: FHIPEP family type III secretion protein [Methylibium sp.]|uniref:FHIPEP family type III secretion protein n=1 Tax=Methylibium sp. TaxID=2067992 RepID=UPI00184767F5|nr:FHIPEP family type III secretion protein [Methylibium sp.]MBA3596416.1 FHIPEP family type III secretion protein [Methylibium sp.]
MSSLWERILVAVTRHSHLLMAVLITGVVALMVLPVPPVALDMLIALNIALSILLLMLAIYIPAALGMSTFPSLIVLTTVLRLSLNIASTKQILLHAHAGQIIETFGRLVMGGQVIVGLVVFSIIAVVQFIVISKGAERVAEVGARFTLDALPGKQMSIEADLRGGFIDKHEARRLRALLEQESHMHGSMDGAMKFVKGDAIAAIIIALVNIVAGISIGAWVLDMPIADAGARYTLLSVGDGMVSQIPSLLTCVAAGILITRVAGQEGNPRNLASQIGQQVIAQPMALLASSGILFGFMLVPGFPKLPFLLLGTVLAFLGLRSLRRNRVLPSLDGVRTLNAARAGAPEAANLLPFEAPAIVVPLLLRIAGNLRDRLSPAALQEALERERADLQHELGMPFPELQVRFDATLPDDAYALDVQEIPSRQGSLSQAFEPGATIGAEARLAHEAAGTVRLRPDAFVGTQEINGLLKRVQAQLPDLAEEVMRTLPTQRVADVLRRLALEGVSLRYLREIYESLLTWAGREKDTAMLCEYVRIDLGRFICHRLVDAERRLHVITLDAAAEAQVRGAIQQGPNGAYVAMPPDALQALYASTESAVATVPAERPVVMLVTLETRRFMRRLLSQRWPQMHIVSYAELPSDLQIQPIARIGLPNAAPLRAVSE